MPRLVFPNSWMMSSAARRCHHSGTDSRLRGWCLRMPERQAGDTTNDGTHRGVPEEHARMTVDELISLRGTRATNTDAVRPRRVDDRQLAAAWTSVHPTRCGRTGFDRDFALAPSLWWFEIRNLFIMNERRGWTTNGQTTEALALLRALPIEIDGDPVEATVCFALPGNTISPFMTQRILSLRLTIGLPLATSIANFCGGGLSALRLSESLSFSELDLWND